MREPEVLCDSTTSKPMPRWMSAMAIILGGVFLFTAYREFTEVGRTGKLIYNLFIGIICMYGAGISRKIYLSDQGVIREMHSWGRVIRRVLPWKDVRHVALAFRGNRMMAFFEEGATGWKVLFSRDQERCVRDILDDMLPGVEVEDLQG